MKIIPTLFLVAMFAAVASAAQFEGIVEYQITAGKRTSDVRYLIKDDRMRMEMALGDDKTMVTLYDGEAGDAKILLPGQTMYLTIGGVKKLAADAMPADVLVEETGRTAEIAGYPCAEYIFTDKKNIFEVWATTKLGRYIDLTDIQRRRGRSPSWAQIMYQKELFALRTITKDKRGRERSRMEATNVEPQELDAAQFEVPEGYQPIRVPGLRDLLPGG